MDTLRALAEKIRSEADWWEQRGHRGEAVCCREHAQLLEDALRQEECALLAPDDAAAYSGYSKAHLRYLVTQGKLVNRGRPRSPLYRKSELPVRPKGQMGGVNGTGKLNAGANRGSEETPGQQAARAVLAKRRAA
jgi:hypothetical protein